MREILFRGKNADTGEWVYGYLSSEHTISATSTIGNWDEIVIDPSTVGQYTGIKDQNGTKIFEGDICYEGSIGCEKYGYREFTIEKWFIVNEFDPHQGIAIEKIKERRGNYAWGWDKCHETFFAYREVRNGIDVVGNIHDNPEIIEDAKTFVWTDKYQDENRDEN